MRVGSSHAADGMTQNEFLSRLWPFKHELLEWAVNFFTPLFAYFFFPRIIYPVRWIRIPDIILAHIPPLPHRLESLKPLGFGAVEGFPFLLAYRPIQHSVYLLQAAIMDADDETDDVKSAVSAAVIVNKVVSRRNLGFKAASGVFSCKRWLSCSCQSRRALNSRAGFELQGSAREVIELGILARAIGDLIFLLSDTPLHRLLPEHAFERRTGHASGLRLHERSNGSLNHRTASEE
ncbi:hypothetical protein Q3G72_034313 [Acer saccharum]|nr:hypothetical protein Q3G72_034313 [Acer saccharum]